MKKNFINKNKKFYFLLLLLILIVVLIMSCKKVNLLGPNNIPPPTKFPIIDDEKPEIPDYPDPTPVPDPPDEGDIEEKPDSNSKMTGMFQLQMNMNITLKQKCLDN